MTTETYNVYSEDNDMTFIMEDTYNEEELLVSTKVVGFYYGKPDWNDTEKFKGKLEAKYE